MMKLAFLFEQLAFDSRLQHLSDGFVFVLGLLIGSFLNVVIARLPEGRSIVRPRSSCPSCGSMIRWQDNIPLVSWVLLRARCRSCRAPISVRYPLVELLCGALFLATWLLLSRGETSPAFLPGLFRDWTVMAVLLAVTFIDLDHRIIPDELSIGGTFFVLALSPFAAYPGWQGALLGAGLGFGVFYGFAWLYLAMTGRSGLGGGDIKLLAMLGGWLGLPGMLATILVSSVLGSAVGLVWGLADRIRRARAPAAQAGDEDSLLRFAIPYGPFLVIGALFFYFFRRMEWLQFMIPI